MRDPLKIIIDVKNVLYWSQPILKYDEILKLINELETTLKTPIEVLPVVEEVVEEHIIGEILEVTFSEPILIEEVVVEEPAVSTVKVKRPRKK
jgi:hypothetical protein